jgi:hypothetical protein
MFRDNEVKRLYSTLDTHQRSAHWPERDGDDRAIACVAQPPALWNGNIYRRILPWPQVGYLGDSLVEGRH